MPKKDSAEDKIMNNMDKAFEKSTGMKVIQPIQPGLGKTTFAKDEKVKK
jgi:hypothetical protein